MYNEGYYASTKETYAGYDAKTDLVVPVSACDARLVEWVVVGTLPPSSVGAVPVAGALFRLVPAGALERLVLLSVDAYMGAEPAPLAEHCCAMDQGSSANRWCACIRPEGGVMRTLKYAMHAHG